MPTIWIVDDEPSLLRLFGLCLEAPGRQILRHARPEELIGRLEAGERPDLIITDHDMPGMTGNQLATAAWALAYAGPILLLTSRGANGVPHLAAVTRYEGKPIGIEDLRKIVAQMLAARVPSA